MDEFKNQLARNAKYIVWACVTLLGSVSLLFFAQFFSEIKALQFLGDDLEFRHTIIVSGEGEVTAIPDTAEFSFAIIDEDKEVAKAQEKVSKKMNDIIAFLKNFGIPEKDVKTTSYNITPLYEWKSEPTPLGIGASYPGRELIYPYPVPEPDKTRVLKGYEVSHWVLVKARETDKVGEILGEVGNRGATNVGSIQFTLDDENAVQAEARKKAIDDAREKARLLASQLGVHLVKVVNFSEGGGPIYYRGFALEAAKADGVGGDFIPPEIPVGENTFSSNVTITYAIE